MAKFSLGAMPDVSFAGTAFLHFDCHTPAYELAADLGRLFGLRLRRLPADMPLRDAQWPLYHFADAKQHLVYAFAEVPPTPIPLPLLHPGSKLLVVQGREADTMIEAIEAELRSNAPRTDILDADRRFAIVQHHQRQLFDLYVIRFSDDDVAAASSRRRKSLRGSAALAGLMADMLDYFSLHGLSRDWD